MFSLSRATAAACAGIGVLLTATSVPSLAAKVAASSAHPPRAVTRFAVQRIPNASGDDIFANLVLDRARRRLLATNVSTERVARYSTSGKLTGQSKPLCPVSAQQCASTIATVSATGLSYVLVDTPSYQVVVLRGLTVVARIGVKVDTSLGMAEVNQPTGDLFVSSFQGDGNRVAIIHGKKLLRTVTTRGPVTALTTYTGGPYSYIFSGTSKAGGHVEVFRGATFVRSIRLSQRYPYGVGNRKNKTVFVVGGSSRSAALLRNGRLISKNVAVPGLGGFPQAVAAEPAHDSVAVAGLSQVVVLEHDRQRYVDRVKGGGIYNVFFARRSGLLIVESENSNSTFLTTVFSGRSQIQQFKSGKSDGSVFDFQYDSRSARLFYLYDDGNSVQALQTPNVANIRLRWPSRKAYRRGQRVKAKYTCTAGVNNQLESCVGTTRQGKYINTRTSGVHRFTVTAKSKYGSAAHVTVDYTVRK